MESDAGVRLASLKVDGGMVRNETLMQFQADILGVPVIRPHITETTALGVAYAAGLATGFWNDIEELRHNWTPDRKWQPTMDVPQRDALFLGWKRAVTRTFDWIEE
jgi:glycerol kinase